MARSCLERAQGCNPSPSPYVHVFAIVTTFLCSSPAYLITIIHHLSGLDILHYLSSSTFAANKAPKTLFLSNGSAWGLSLFQSPFDYARVEELDEEAGIKELEKRDVAKAKASGKTMPVKNTPRGLWCDPEYGVHYSILAEKCSGIKAVREHLDGGVLAKMFAHWEKEIHEYQEGDFTRTDPRHKFVLLGACAMTLGCTISEAQQALMRSIVAKKKADLKPKLRSS